MSRTEFGLLLMAAVMAVIVAAIVSSSRYARYRHARASGRGKPKPVWKPFWMD